MYAMFAIVFLALYVVLRKVNNSGMAIAFTLALPGIAILFASNNPFSMLSLSREFAAATTHYTVKHQKEFEHGRYIATTQS